MDMMRGQEKTDLTILARSLVTIIRPEAMLSFAANTGFTLRGKNGVHAFGYKLTPPKLNRFVAASPARYNCFKKHSRL